MFYVAAFLLGRLLASSKAKAEGNATFRSLVSDS
jgi:hypothetical protein